MKRRHFLSTAIAASLVGCSSRTHNESPTTMSPVSTETTRRTSTSTTEKTTERVQKTEAGNGAPEGADVQRLNGEDVWIKPYNLRSVNYRTRPQWGRTPYGEDPTPYTGDQIQNWPDTYMANIGEGGHHPLRTTRVMYLYLHHYHVLGDDKFLKKAKQMAAALVDEQTTTHRGAYFFNYGFDYTTPTMGTRYEAPWWSCMSQGTGLSAFARLAEETGEAEYRQFADAVFKSIYQLRDDSSAPWVAYVSPDRFLWLEEYPEEPESHVLNGLLIGLWGVYEYWLSTGDDRAKRLIQASITSLEAKAREWRVPGSISRYSLADDDPAPKKYHRQHILIWRKLAFLAREPAFERIASRYYQDYPLATVGCENLSCSRSTENGA